MNAFLRFSRKIRIRVKGDGHCLPRAVFRGAKSLNLLPQFIKYSELLEAAIEDIKVNMDKFQFINVNGTESATKALDTYYKEKKYNSQENIIDAVIVSLAKITRCSISVHYQRGDLAFYQHDYPAAGDSAGK